VAGAIRFGASVSVSGRYALQGRQVLAGLRAWVEAVNAGGGLRVHGAGARAPVRLVYYHDASSAAKAAGTVEDETLKAMRDLEHQQWVHLFGPDREVKTKVDLQSHISIRSKGVRLRSSRSTEAHLLEQYQQLDDELQILEAAIDFMMFETERRAWAEEDRARGN
jgi:hypothetical protein